MRQTLRSLSKKITLISTAFVLAVSGIVAITPFMINQRVDAISSPSTIYDALPNVTPQRNYPSQAFQATSTSEFGDYVHLAGTNRKLSTITVTMSTWAKFSDYALNPTYSANTSYWVLPVTLNIYSNQFDSNGTPTNKIKSVEKSINIPWRPEADSTCPDTGYGSGFAWRNSEGTCYNGYAFNAVFDLASAEVILPDDVVVSVAYNTQTHGYSPTGVAGPFDSLNVAVPMDQTVAVGADNDTSAVLVNSTWVGAYGSVGSVGVFRKDTGWSPNGTMAMQITATTPPTVAACTTMSTVATTSLSTWYLGDTRTAGHSVLTADGLHVWTTPSSGSYENEFSKAAGYFAANFALADAGTPDITIASGYAGVRPSLQLGIDKDNNGSWDGYLVYEPWAYGVGNFWSSKNFGIASGAGYTSFGSLNDYLNANPNARVISIGYSLGSGVVGDAIITKVTAGCTDYTFGLAAPNNLTPAYGAVTTDPDFSMTWGSVEGAVGYEYQTSYTTNGSALGTIIYSDSSATKPDRYTTNGGVVTRSNIDTPDNTYFWQVRAVDADGNPGPWSEISKVTVDMTAPAAPSGLSWVDSNNNGAQNGFTNTQQGTLTWASTNPGDVDHYVYKFWTNISGYPNIPGGVWTTEPNHRGLIVATSTGGSIWTNFEHEGSYYFCVEAVDQAGNNSGCSNTLTITYDKSAPMAEFIFPVAGQAAKSFRVQFNESVKKTEAENAANYFLNNWPGAGGSGDLAGDATVVYDDATHSATVTFTNADWYVSPEQQWGIRNVHDLGGNVLSETTAYSTPLVLPTAPGVPTLTSSRNSLATNWQWAAATDPTDSTNASGVKGYEYSLVAVNSMPTAWLFTSGTTISITVPSDGSYRLYVRALDNAGNTGSEVYSEVTIDTVAPSVTVNAIAESTSTMPTVTGTTSELGGDVMISLDGVAVATVTSSAKGEWSWTPTTTLMVGTHTVIAMATDTAGNTSGADITTPQDYWKQFVITSVPSNNSSTTTTATAAAVQTTASTRTLTTTAVVTNATDGDGNDGTGTLGTETQTTGDTSSIATGDEDSSQVSAAGASDSKDSTTGDTLGLAWYWWFVILATIVALWWFIVAWRRRRSEEN